MEEGEQTNNGKNTQKKYEIFVTEINWLWDKNEVNYEMK